jgi:hypothetical protein
VELRVPIGAFVPLVIRVSVMQAKVNDGEGWNVGFSGRVVRVAADDLVVFYAIHAGGKLDVSFLCYACCRNVMSRNGVANPTGGFV